MSDEWKTADHRMGERLERERSTRLLFQHLQSNKESFLNWQSLEHKNPRLSKEQTDAFASQICGLVVFGTQLLGRSHMDIMKSASFTNSECERFFPHCTK
jgi:hypothetical protein